MKPSEPTKNKYSYCVETGKYSYSSEAKAIRALNRYEEIQRVYKCDSCNEWHTTSIGKIKAIEMGLIRKKRKTGKVPSEDKIQQRLNELKNKENAS